MPAAPPVAGTSRLPDKALTHLDKLKPATAAPVNPKMPETTPRVKALIDEAQALIVKRDFSGAMERLDRAVGFEPDNPRALKQMALAYVGLSNYGKAIESLRRGIALAPDDLDGQLLLGRLLAAQNQNDQAIVAYRSALATTSSKPEEPMTAEALVRLGEALEREGYLTASLDCYEKLNEWLAAHADAYTKSPLLQPLLLRPERLMLQRGSVLLQLGRSKEAAEQLTKAYRTDRSNVLAGRLLVEALAADKQFDAAQNVILEMASQPAQQDQVASLTEVLAKASGNKDLPLTIWNAYLKSGKKDASLAVSMASVAQQTGGVAQAESILKSSLEKTPGSLTAGTMLASLYASSNRPEQALRQLAAILSGSADESAQLEPSLRQVAQSAPVDFETQFAQKIQADATPQSAALHFLTGRLAALRQNADLASREYDLAIKAQADFLPAYDAKLDICIARRQDAATEKLLQQAKSLDDTKYGYFKAYLEGKRKLALGDVDAAMKDLRQANEQARNADVVHLPTLILLARTQVLAKQPNEAVGTLLEAMKSEPDNEVLYRHVVSLLISQSQYNDAQDVITRLQERLPGSLTARILQAELMVARNQSPEAAKLLAELKKSNPDNIDVQLLDFRVQFGKNPQSLKGAEFDRAVKRLGDILKIDPANEQAFLLLASLLDQPTRKKDMAAIWGKVYEQSGKSPLIAKAYGMALVQAEQYAQAEEVFRAALAGAPRDPVVRMLLLQSLQKVKKNAQAAQLAQQWLADAQDDETRTSYRRLLLSFYEESTPVQYDKAQKLLDEWITLTADAKMQSSLRNEKLKLYGKDKQYDAAVAFGRQWIKDEQKRGEGADMLPRFQLLSMLDDANEHDRMLALLKEWIGTSTDKSVAWLRAQQIMTLGDSKKMAEAAKLANEWIAQDANQLLPRQTYIAMLSKAQKYDEALTLVEGWLGELVSKKDLNVPPKAATTPASTPATQGVLTKVGYSGVVTSNPTLQIYPSAPAKIRTAVDPIVIDWCRMTVVQLLVSQQKYAQGMAKADEYLKLYGDYKPTPAEGRAGDGSIEQDYVLNMYVLKATCLSETNRPEEAITTLEKALSLNPADPMLNNDIGYMYADLGVNLDKAERMVRVALAGIGSTPSLLDSLGWVFYKQGKFTEAQRVFEQVLQADIPDRAENSVIFDHVADTYYRLGDKTNALKNWKLAIERASREKPAGSDARKVLQRVPAKVQAVEKGQAPALAPLGKGVEVK